MPSLEPKSQRDRTHRIHLSVLLTFPNGRPDGLLSLFLEKERLSDPLVGVGALLPKSIHAPTIGLIIKDDRPFPAGELVAKQEGGKWMKI